MARCRNIKPSFFTNEHLGECSAEARLLFAGLWCWADRAGRLEDRPKKLKAEIFPYDDWNVSKLLDLLASKGFIVRYSVDGRNYIAISNFSKHQNPHINEKESEIPDPISDSTVQAQCNSGAVTRAIGLIPSFLIPDSLSSDSLDSSELEIPAREPTSGAKKKAASRDAELNGAIPVMQFPVVGGGPTEWNLTESKLAQYRESFPGIDVLAECKAARQWCLDNPKKRKTATGMPAFLGRWLSHEQNRNRALSPTSQTRARKPIPMLEDDT